ncbi:hypothetical protein [Tenacibaculum soleae]|uniref:hypothetical protein n=1 Tax=Tenacibaculum soleae TaxID=447689 RepID=UPI0026E45B68|nr:hypothetical protein [Tenacibaculum soleae]MDO6812237.1 hypothetical protein [Tenacibaculum soleae]
MKKVFKIITVFSISFYSCSSIPKDSKLYERAYDYVKLRHQKLIVSDSINNLDLTIFSDKIAEKKSKDLIKVLDSLSSIQDSNFFNPYNYSLSKKLDLEKGEIFDYKAFFSKPINNSLLVEVYKTNKNLNYKEIMFGSSDAYLFKFKNSKIISVDSVKIDYN